MTRGPSWGRRALRLAGFVLAIATGLAALLYALQDRLVYYPSAAITRTPAERGLAFEVLSIATADGEAVAAWFMPASGRSRGVLLFCHGNGGNISGRVDLFAALHELDVDVLAFDYRGYGESSGSPSEAGTYADVRAAYRYLVEVRGVPPARIVLMGRSLGGAIATALAAEVEAAGLIVEASFTRLPDVGAEIYPWLPVSLLSRIHYPSVDRIGAVDMPVLIRHSRADSMIPFHHGEALFAAAREPKRFQEVAGDHNETLGATGADYVEGLRGFLDVALGPPGG